MFKRVFFVLALSAACGTALPHAYAQNAATQPDPSNKQRDLLQDRADYKASQSDIRKDKSGLATDRKDIKEQTARLSREEENLKQLRAQYDIDTHQLQVDQKSGDKAAVSRDQAKVQQDKVAINKSMQAIDAIKGNLHYYEKQQSNEDRELYQDSAARHKDMSDAQRDQQRK